MLKKAVIFAGGLGSRLSEETNKIPKPLVEIGGIPIIVHIMRHLYKYGINDFTILCGYKGNLIKEYFSKYEMFNRNVSFTSNKDPIYFGSNLENWTVTCLDTGYDTMTGGRLRKAFQYIKNTNEDFLLTYGDGLCDVNITDLYKFHKSHGKLATVTAVQPLSSRFGTLKIEDEDVLDFKEKIGSEDNWINGGFFILNNYIYPYLQGDDTLTFEKEPLESLVKDQELKAFKHTGFWKCMDTIQDKNALEEIWKEGNAPWKI